MFQALLSSTTFNTYRTPARPVLIYGSEAWTIRKADEKRLQAAEIKFLRKTIGLTLSDQKKKLNLKFEPIFQCIQKYRANWNILKEWILAESQTTF
jgi:hypothetical protein